MTDQDQRIVDQVLSGDRQAFRSLVERHQDRLYDLALRLTRHRQEAEDIVQTAFVRMYSKLSSFDPEFGFSNWAYTVTLNVARDVLRRRTILRFFSLDKPDPLDEKTPAHIQPADASPSPEEHFSGSEMLAELDRLIPTLPGGLGATFILRYFHHNDIEQIAQQLGVSTNVVHVRLSRARERLYQGLKDKFPSLDAADVDKGGHS